MIYVEIKGRAGNQFFRYAYARKVQEERNNKDELKLGFHNMNGRDPNDGWCDILCDFQVKTYSTENKRRLVWAFGSPVQKLIAFLYYIEVRIFAKNKRMKRIERTHKWFTVFQKFGLLYLSESFHEYKSPKSKNIIIDGGYQSSKYFSSIRKKLLTELQPKYPLLDKNKEFYKKILSNNSVCITIRRGDYVTNTNFKKVYDICGIEYFKKAIDIAKKRIQDPLFVIFSDDVNWAKDNLDINSNTIYESGDDPIWEKIRLMSSCKHFIISNSTFSWWAQYLGQYEEKLVISPNRWYNGNFPCYLIEDSWIKIKV